jgi:hypothetical protein
METLVPQSKICRDKHNSKMVGWCHFKTHIHDEEYDVLC